MRTVILLTVAVLTAGCFGSSSPSPAPTTSAGGRQLGVPSWLVKAASSEALRLGDPTVTSASVGPITADQARVVFRHLRPTYPPRAYLLVLHGAFVSPRFVCPPGARCPLFVPRLFTNEVELLTHPVLSSWRGLAIGGPFHPAPRIPIRLRRIHFPAHPAVLPRGPLFHLAIAQALAMHATRMRDIGVAPLTGTQAVRLFGAGHRAGYLVLEAGLFHNPPPSSGATQIGHGWFRWEAFEYTPGSSTPAAFRSLPLACSADSSHPIYGIRLTWLGIPDLFPTAPHDFYANGSC